MGFFSFKTQDTKRSISNAYSTQGTFTVYLHNNKGTVWVEDNYDGYGNFGGVDFFGLMASMNKMRDRQEAINAWCAKQEGLLYPNLSESPEWEWRNESPERCEFQGYFYN